MMKHKNFIHILRSKKRHFIHCAFFFLIALFTFCILTNILTVGNEHGAMHIYGFYQEPKDSLDVVLVGSSEFYADYSAPLAWDKYRFTSYPIAFAAAPSTVYLSITKEIYNYQSPNVLVFETNGFLYPAKHYEEETDKRSWIDAMPWSENKLETIKNVIPKEERYTYYVPLTKYHSNWIHPGKCFNYSYDRIKMRRQGYSLLKSFQSRTTMSEITKPTKQNISYCDVARKCMLDILEYCKSKGIKDVLFIRSPHMSELNDKKPLDTLQKDVESYGYKFVNFEDYYDEIGIDNTTDYYDTQHLNVLGSEKFTSYLGKYLRDNYDLPTSHSEDIEKEWDFCAEYTKNAFKICGEKTRSKTNESVYELTDFSK